MGWRANTVQVERELHLKVSKYLLCSSSLMERTRGLSLSQQRSLCEQRNAEATRTLGEREPCAGTQLSVFMHICWHGGYAIAMRCLSKIAPRSVLGTIRCNDNISQRCSAIRRRRFLICTTPPRHWTAVGRPFVRRP